MNVLSGTFVIEGGGVPVTHTGTFNHSPGIYIILNDTQALTLSLEVELKLAVQAVL